MWHQSKQTKQNRSLTGAVGGWWMPESVAGKPTCGDLVVGGGQVYSCPVLNACSEDPVLASIRI